MKTFLLIFTVLIVTDALSDELIESFVGKLTEFSEICVTKTGSNADDISEILSGEHPSRRQGKCFLACMGESFGVMDNDGRFDKEKTVSLIRPVKEDDPVMYFKILKIVDRCSKEVIEVPDACETATILMQCARKYADRYGLFDDLDFRK